MLTNNYYKKLLNLKLDSGDIGFLTMLNRIYAEKTKPMQGRNPDGTLRPVFHNYRDFYFKNADINYSDNPLFEKIEKCLNGFKDKNYIYNKFHLALIPSVLPYHIDKRECALTIPLNQPKYPITWIDEQERIVESYDYESPVLINTKIRHGCLQNDETRVLFQIGFEDPFDIVKEFIN